MRLAHGFAPLLGKGGVATDEMYLHVLRAPLPLDWDPGVHVVGR